MPGLPAPHAAVKKRGALRRRALLMFALQRLSPEYARLFEQPCPLHFQ